MDRAIYLYLAHNMHDLYSHRAGKAIKAEGGLKQSPHGCCPHASMMLCFLSCWIHTGARYSNECLAQHHAGRIPVANLCGKCHSVRQLTSCTIDSPAGRVSCVHEAVAVAQRSWSNGRDCLEPGKSSTDTPCRVFQYGFCRNQTGHNEGL